MLMSNVHVKGDVVEAEDVDVGADGCVNVEVKVAVDVVVDVDVDVDIGK